MSLVIEFAEFVAQKQAGVVHENVDVLIANRGPQSGHRIGAADVNARDYADAELHLTRHSRCGRRR